MSDEKDHHEDLIQLLRQAATRFLALGHRSIWNSNDYTDDLGHFCNQVADKLYDGKLSDEDKKKIFLIFAPTCEWDDAIGDVGLGNQVFEHLNALFRELVLNGHKH